MATSLATLQLYFSIEMIKILVPLSIVIGWGNCMFVLRTVHSWLRLKNKKIFWNLTTILKEDLAFWGIDELSLQACCSLKYYSQISSCQSELEEERNKRYGFYFCRYLFCNSAIHSHFQMFVAISLKLFRLSIIHDNDLDTILIASIIGSPGMLRIREIGTRTLENHWLGKYESFSGTS